MKNFLATLLSFLLLASPLSALASSQVFMSQGIGVSSSNTTLSIQGNIVNKNDGAIFDAFPVAGTISKLWYYRTAAPGGVITVTATLLVNGATSLLTCTILSGAQSCSDLTHTINVAQGDNVYIKLTQSGTPAGADTSYSMVFTPTTPNDTVHIADDANNGSIATSSLTWDGAVNNAVLESSTAQVFPEGGTLDQFFATSTSIVSSSADYYVFQNGATSTLTCTIGTPDFRHCSDTTHSLTIAKGDTFSLRESLNGPKSKGGFTVRFVPTTAGNFDFMYTAGNGNGGTAGATRFYPLVGGRTSNAATEASTTAVIAANTTFTSMQVLTANAPGAAQTKKVTLRVNSADSSLTCQLAGSGTGDGITTKTCTGSVSVVAGDLLDYSTTLSAGASPSTISVSLVGAPTVAVAATNPLHMFFNAAMYFIGQMFFN